MLYGKFPNIIIFSFEILFKSNFKTSLFKMLILSLNFPLNKFTKLESFSITKIFFGFFFKIYSVKFPVPGPTSTITLFFLTSPIFTIDFIIFLSNKKF